MALFPTPAEVEASTPATRDRAIDVIRIVSLVGVVVGHTVMATSTLRVAVMLIALLAARRLASDPQRVCATSLPARTT